MKGIQRGKFIALNVQFKKKDNSRISNNNTCEDFGKTRGEEGVNKNYD